MADPSPTLMGSLLFASEAGRNAYHDSVEEAESGVQPFKQFDPRLYAVGNEPAGQKGCLAKTGQRMGSLGLFLAVQPVRLWRRSMGRTTLRGNQRSFELTSSSTTGIMYLLPMTGPWANHWPPTFFGWN